MNIPIACRLAEPAARAQLEEWRDLLAETAISTTRVSPSELAFRLRDDLPQLNAVVRLAQREKVCCPFFDFAIQIESDAVSLRVSVPDDAVSVLDEFAGVGRV
jgi:hypothetical protein